MKIVDWILFHGKQELRVNFRFYLATYSYLYYYIILIYIKWLAKILLPTKNKLKWRFCFDHVGIFDCWYFDISNRLSIIVLDNGSISYFFSFLSLSQNSARFKISAIIIWDFEEQLLKIKFTLPTILYIVQFNYNHFKIDFDISYNIQNLTIQ